MGFKKKSRTNLSSATTSRPEVLPEAEPPEPRMRSPDKDPASMEDARHQRSNESNVPLSGEKRHVITTNSERPSEPLNPLTMWKGKSRSLSPQQYRSRETFLSPKQSKSTVIERGEYIFPMTEEDIPPRTRPSSSIARTSEEWTTTNDSQDPYSRRKLRKRVNPASENPDTQGTKLDS